jgi:mono/diheme cytochrome c family protein
MAYTVFRSEKPNSRADPTNSQLVALGAKVYGNHCATCHGRNLEGQPDWQTRRADGRLPAPPHDETGHTWHHPDRLLFDVTKRGVEASSVQNYESDMPAYAGILSDEEIWAVLAYIKSRWPRRTRAVQSGINRRAAQGGSR